MGVELSALPPQIPLGFCVEKMGRMGMALAVSSLLILFGLLF